MDILRNLVGSATSGIIRLLVTVGIISAVGYFLVKSGLGGLAKQIEDVSRRVQRQVQRSFRAAKGERGNAEKLLRCVQRANQDVVRIRRCTARF